MQEALTLGKLGAEVIIGALLVFVVVYLIKTIIPNMQNQFSEDLGRIVTAFTEAQSKVVYELEKQGARLDRTEHAIDKLSTIILMHDATIRGVNPDHGTLTTDEILKALRNDRPEHVNVQSRLRDI